MDRLIIGRIYKFYGTTLYRIFKCGRSGYYSGRGFTKQTAIPNNYLSPRDALLPTTDEVNYFLEQEMKNGMAQTINTNENSKRTIS